MSEQKMFDVEANVGAYVWLRDEIKRREKAFEEALEPLKVKQNKLMGAIMDHLEKTNAQSVNTKAGTCYLSTRYSASLADAEAFMKFIISNNRFDLIDKRANGPAVHQYVATTGSVPPGCNLSALKTLGVNRPRS